jgi:hypothetical protein
LNRRSLLAGISTFVATVSAGGVRKVWAEPRSKGEENKRFDPAGFIESPIWEARPEDGRIVAMHKFGDSLIICTEKRTIELAYKE